MMGNKLGLANMPKTCPREGKYGFLLVVPPEGNIISYYLIYHFSTELLNIFNLVFINENTFALFLYLFNNREYYHFYRIY